MDELLQKAADALRTAKRIAVSSGAGVSKESGIPTYRDALTGLWSNYSFQELASPEGFRANPDKVWDWYTERRMQLKTVHPNAGHIALAKLADIVPALTIITQNIDDLHERGGSRDVMHLHGKLNEVKCFYNCQGEPTLVDEAHFVHGESSPPTCPHCGRWLRPNVVWFGEMLPVGIFDRAEAIVAQSDVFIVAGTSGVVFPAAQLPLTAKQAGATVIEINPDATDYDAFVDISLHGAFGQVMPALLDRVIQGR